MLSEAEVRDQIPVRFQAQLSGLGQGVLAWERLMQRYPAVYPGFKTSDLFPTNFFTFHEFGGLGVIQWLPSRLGHELMGELSNESDRNVAEKVGISVPDPLVFPVVCIQVNPEAYRLFQQNYERYQPLIAKLIYGNGAAIFTRPKVLNRDIRNLIGAFLWSRDKGDLIPSKLMKLPHNSMLLEGATLSFPLFENFPFVQKELSEPN